MPRKPDPTARDRILEIAAQLFDSEGVHAVGLQQIIDAASCGKNTLYREFATKDELVAAYVVRSRDGWTAALERAAQAASDPADQLLVIVSDVAEQTMAAEFRGCAIYNAHAEFPDPTHPVNKAATANFQLMHESLLDIARRAGAADPRTLADRIMLIIDGLKANGAAMGRTGAAPAAVKFAEEVIHNALQPISPA
ncbi:AcrR family transcriptional regulator [Kibdelosporangium banguiense]|uniref:AcrR family transcriptional regulator n=1 Tax=Kibdelosporangium banguiense TaxID=1365924 RepID=A0ABS4TZL8_9PSEU|nr:TetR/AcrR family transcriptional regulator [Kibdelosporangium banguiense]MBP2329854.1 AcrR family transcriptional regulator [Kibdelosporangium banguiense]